MFLMSTKALAWLFFILTILNFPVYVFFWESNESAVHAPQDYFAKLSLGNIGQTEFACSAMNFQLQRVISMSCSTNFAQMEDLQYFGLANTDQDTC